jgi:hypothetical protein
MERRSFEIVPCDPPGIGAKKVQEGSRNSFVSTYIGGVVALEYGVVDLHIGITVNINSSALKVACPAPGIGAKKAQRISETRFGTYIIGAVTLERAGIDINIGTAISKNCSALKVACGPPGIGAKNLQESSRNSFGGTYIGAGSVAVESAGVDLDICIISKNSPALKVACPPPGIGAKF